MTEDRKKITGAFVESLDEAGEASYLERTRPHLAPRSVLFLYEVMLMKSRPFLFALALLFILAANLNLGCRIRINGKTDDTVYSLGTVRQAEAAAAAAAEEILSRHARMPEISRHLVLSLRPCRGDSKQLSGRILAEVPGVSRLYAVRFGEESFGVVADRDRLEERLRAALYGSMPPSSVRACYSAGIEILPVYGRTGSESTPSDMALIVSGSVPAVFLDAEGEIVG